MKTWIVSYADAAFLSGRERLMQSAARCGIDELRPWGRDALERSSLYRMHKPVLDMVRGGGYWLWKPFIVKETLKEMAPGDLLIYSDAGIEIIADLSPLFQICLERAEILLFAGHYDDAGAPGPNLCGKWTKRDCFVFMDCDEPRYYESQLLDASFTVLLKTPRALGFIHEWFLYCCQPQLLTDAPNVCGLLNVPGFIEHRHDQSVLSLLATRENLKLFRHPSQQGNHLKEAQYREPGEWVQAPYGSKGIYHNSPYRTLLDHHRGMLGQQELHVSLRRVLPAPRERVFQAWTDPNVLKRWSPLGTRVVAVDADVRVGGEYQLRLNGGLASPGLDLDLAGTYLEVQPPARLVYTWCWDTRVAVEFHDERNATAISLTHASFPTEKLREFHRAAWNDFLDTVAASIEART